MKTCLQNCKPGDVIIYGFPGGPEGAFDVVDTHGAPDYVTVYTLSQRGRAAHRFTQAHMELGRIKRIIKKNNPCTLA